MALVLTPGSARSAELLRGRCHMGSCGWFSVEEKELVGSSREGALFKAVLKGWESHHPDGDYARKAPRQGGRPTTSYFFCSRTKPAVIVRDGQSRWQVDYLDLNAPDGPPGVMETATATYYAVCHAVGADHAESFTQLGHRFGYPAPVAAEGKPISVPADLLNP